MANSEPNQIKTTTTKRTPLYNRFIHILLLQNSQNFQLESGKKQQSTNCRFFLILKPMVFWFCKFYIPEVLNQPRVVKALERGKGKTVSNIKQDKKKSFCFVLILSKMRTELLPCTWLRAKQTKEVLSESADLGAVPGNSMLSCPLLKESAMLWETHIKASMLAHAEQEFVPRLPRAQLSILLTTCILKSMMDCLFTATCISVKRFTEFEFVPEYKGNIKICSPFKTQF